MYRCKEQGRCPGGPLGTCATRRTDVACALCELGSYPSMDGRTQACFLCKQSDTATFVAVVVGAFILTCLFHVAVSLPMSNQKHSTLLTTSVIGILCTLLQAFSVVERMEIHWSPFMRAIFERMKILMFDPRIFRMGCVVRTPPVILFAARVCIIPIVFAYVCLAHVVLGQVIGIAAVRGVVPLYNTLGTVFMTFFISVARITVAPFECYDHPTPGLASLAPYPTVICSSDEHALMYAGGIG